LVASNLFKFWFILSIYFAVSCKNLSQPMKTKTFPSIENQPVVVGRRLRELRSERGLSIRALAEQSGLNVNTLSLIENCKTSPSVSTLQQVATALKVPITAFFETETPLQAIVYQKEDNRQVAAFAHGTLADLGAGFIRPGVEPFVVTLEPQADSGDTPIVHTGVEFVFCLEGRISYVVDNRTFTLDPGDSLLFEAHLPHRWRNAGETPSRSLLLLCPADERDHPDERHFTQET
jgi:transcriptional regulator with XRE-family HTH domain